MNSFAASTLTLADTESLLLAISQSGDTFDTLQALRQGRAAGTRTAAIVNVPGSSVNREAERVISLHRTPSPSCSGQLLTYETAVVLGRNVDRPRSPAKLMTVS